MYTYRRGKLRGWLQLNAEFVGKANIPLLRKFLINVGGKALAEAERP